MREEIGVGKTIEEAVAEACRRLGVSPQDENVRTEVLEAPQKKLFRTIPGRVKVTLEEAAPAETQPEPATAPAQVSAEPAPAVQPEPAAQPKAEEKKQETRPEGRSRKNRRSEGEEEVQISIEDNPKLKAAVDYLKEIFAAMGADKMNVYAVQKGETVIIKVEGKQAGMLIGRRGETMESLSYLAGLVANRMEGDYIKLGLDVAGYRGKREADLQQMARRIGVKVRKSGRSHALDPMNPYERRIIHSAISQMDGLRSESSGEGRDRHVVIYSTDPDASNLPDRQERYSRRDGRDNRRRSDRDGRGRRDNRRSDRGPRRSSTPEREYSERIWDDTVPIAPSRSAKLEEGEGFALYGKIEL